VRCLQHQDVQPTGSRLSAGHERSVGSIVELFHAGDDPVLAMDLELRSREQRPGSVVVGSMKIVVTCIMECRRTEDRNNIPLRSSDQPMWPSVVIFFTTLLPIILVPVLYRRGVQSWFDFSERLRSEHRQQASHFRTDRGVHKRIVQAVLIVHRICNIIVCFACVRAGVVWHVVSEPPEFARRRGHRDKMVSLLTQPSDRASRVYDPELDR
jgi:hypothetical protein